MKGHIYYAVELTPRGSFCKQMLVCLGVETITGQTLQSLPLPQHSFCVLSAEKEQREVMLSLKINLHNAHKIATTWHPNGPIPCDFPQNYPPFAFTTKLISWKKESPECLGYTLMPTVKFPVVLTACKTSREVWPVLETLTRASDINATEVLCQVKKKMSMPGLDQATHQFPRRKLDFREKNKTDQKQQSSGLGKILFYFRMMLTDALSNSLKT